MSAAIEVRFGVGDTVFCATTDSGTSKVVCPDCLGQKVWACSLPSGEQLNIECPTCHYGFGGSRGYVEGDYEFRPVVMRCVVGSVRIDTGAQVGKRVSYMMEETGVGSGRIWYDEIVFDNESDASACASRLAAEATERLRTNNLMVRSRKRTDRPGSLVAYLRRAIARDERFIQQKRDHLKRITTKEEAK